MKIDNLLFSLNLVKPALDTNDYIPIFSHFCFDGKTVTTYNDKTAISVPCRAPIVGAIHFDKLLRWLDVPKTSKLKINQDKDRVDISCGRSSISLAYLDDSEFLFEIPDITDATSFLFTEEHILGIKKCMMSISSDEVQTKMQGVTFQSPNKFYATDGETISRYISRDMVDLKFDIELLLPTAFCKNLIHIFDKLEAKDVEIYLTDEFIVADFGNDYILFNRLIDVDKPIDFESIIKRELNSKSRDVFVDIVADLKTAIENTVVINPDVAIAEVIKQRLTITGDDNGLYKSKDLEIPIERRKDIKVTFSPTLLSRGFSACDQICFTENSIMLANADDGFLHLISLLI